MVATKVHLSRPSQFVDRLRDYKIYVDGMQHGQIKDNGELEISLSPGKHVVKLRIDWLSSRDLFVHCSSGGGEIHLECGNAMGWEAHQGLFAQLESILRFVHICFFERSGYLYLKEI